MANVGEEEEKRLNDLGVNLGLAFQLMDDYLDSFGDPKTFGKKVGGDILLNKKTYLVIQSLELGTTEQKSELEDWFSFSGSEEEKIEGVKKLFTETGAKEETLSKMQAYEEKAEQLLSEISGDTESIVALQGLIDDLKQRVK